MNHQFPTFFLQSFTVRGHLFILNLPRNHTQERPSLLGQRIMATAVHLFNKDFNKEPNWRTTGLSHHNLRLGMGPRLHENGWRLRTGIMLSVHLKTTVFSKMAVSDQEGLETSEKVVAVVIRTMTTNVLLRKVTVKVLHYRVVTVVI